MPLGPRLDRPSAVGDEGRPRAASLTVTAVIVVAVVVVVGLLNGSPLLFTSAGLFVGLASAGLALLSRDRVGSVVLGHVCFLPSAVVLAAIVVFSGLTGTTVGLWLLVAGSLLALFGVTAGWNDVFDAESVREALVASALSYVFWLLGVVALLILASVGWLGWTLLDFLITGAGPVVGLLGVVAMVGVASGCLYVAVRTVPAVQLAPEDRRARARERYDVLKSWLLVGAIGSWGLLAAAVLAAATGLLGAVVRPLSAAIAVLTSALTAVLAVVATVALLLSVAVRSGRWAASEARQRSTRSVAAAVAALCYTFGLLLAVPALARFGNRGIAVFFAIPFLPLLIYLVLAGVLLGFYVGAIPRRAGPAALSATGLVAVGLGGALAGYSSLFVFATVAGGLVAWDVGTFGLGVTAELGHRPETRRLELYHGVFAVGVGLVGVAALTVLDAVRQTVAGGIGTPAAMGIAVVGVVLLLVPLRG